MDEKLIQESERKITDVAIAVFVIGMVIGVLLERFVL